jgi:hypothetical protein
MAELSKPLLSRREVDMIFSSNPIDMDRLNHLITKLQNLSHDNVRILENARGEVQYIVTRTDQVNEFRAHFLDLSDFIP